MMPQFSSRRPLTRSKGLATTEQGAILLLMVYVSLALLAVAGVAIDFATIARSTMQVQKAADAGVLAGLAYRVAHRQDQEPEVAVQERALSYALENLVRLGIKSEDVRLEARFMLNDPALEGQESLFVEIEFDTPLVLLPFLPFRMHGADSVPGTKLVAANAKGALPPSNVVLVLDTSNSMACPRSGSCPCQEAQGVCSTHPESDAKIFDLRRGVYSFLEQFRQGYDRISLVSFDIVAQTVVPFRETGFSLEEFESELGKDGQPIPNEKFQPGGMTNPSDGLSEAFQDLKRAQFIEESGRAREPVAIVLFTDGAPTAVDGCFSDIHSGPSFPVSQDQLNDAISPQLCARSARRYSHFEVEWVSSVNGQESRVRGPSPLLIREELLKLPKGERNPGRILATPELRVPCSELSPIATADEHSTAVQRSLGACLKSLEYALPDASRENTGSALGDYKALYYHRAASVADYLRANNFLIYGIGIGAEAIVPPVQDIYQDRNDDFFRKDGLLIALTGHSDLAQQELYDEETGSYSDFPFAGWESWEERVAAKRDGVGRDGYYLQDSDPAKIGDMFTEVARRIQLRIVK